MNILIVHAGAESIAAILERAGQLWGWLFSRVTCDELVESGKNKRMPGSMTLDPASVSAVIMVSTEAFCGPDRLCGLAMRLRCPPFRIAAPILLVLEPDSEYVAKTEWLTAQDIHVVHSLSNLLLSIVRGIRATSLVATPLHDLDSRPLWAVQLELPGHDYRNKIRYLREMSVCSSDIVMQKMLDDAFDLMCPYHT